MRHRRNPQNGRPGSTPRPVAASYVDPRLMGGVLLMLAITWSVLILYAVHIELPVNALDLPFESSIKPNLQAVIPEGWGFFTRDPREARLLPYVRPAGDWQSASEGPNGEAWNAFGLNRAARAQGVEMGLLEFAIPTDAWKDCTEEIGSCLDKLPTSMQVSNPTPHPTLCGDVGFAHRDTLPWAWAASVPDETTMPSKVVRLTVKC
jgi:antimicrobial peptide system SdpA family protein